MRELRELVKYVTRKTLLYPKIIRKSESKTNFEKLYQHIKNGKEITPESFFPDTPHQEKYFNRIKNQLEDRLINSILFLKPDKNESALEKARNKCYKMAAVVNQLKGKEFKRTAAKEAKKALNLAIRYDLTNLIYEFASFLQYYHGSFTGDRTEMNYYTNLVNKSFANLDGERRAQTYMSMTTNHFIKKKTITKEIIEQAEKQIFELDKIKQNISSTRFYLMYYNLVIMIAEMKSDHQRVIDICDEAYQFLEPKESCASAAKFLFQFKKIPALILTKEFQKAEKDINSCLNIVGQNNYNYGVLQVCFAFLGFHSKNQKMIKEALQNFRNQNIKPHSNLTEQITILEAYHQFETNSENFDTPKFTRNVPTFSKDKRGNNINILIAQIILLLKDHAFDAAEIRINALQSYAQKYLKKDTDFRSNCFIKLLATLPKGSFYRVRVEPRAKKYYNKLLSLPLEKAQQPFELEIIQYEILWEKILVLLD